MMVPSASAAAMDFVVAGWTMAPASLPSAPPAWVPHVPLWADIADDEDVRLPEEARLMPPMLGDSWRLAFGRGRPERVAATLRVWRHHGCACRR